MKHQDRFLQWLFPTDRHGMRAYIATIGDLLPESGALLDVGCGKNIHLAHCRTADRHVWGTDFQAHPELQHPDWFRLLRPGHPLPFEDNTFDVITSCWVLEHVEHPTEFLQEIHRVLRPGGSFVSISISGWHYVTWLSRLMGWLPHRWTQTLVKTLYRREHHDTFPTFYRMNTYHDLCRQAQQTGLEAVKLERMADPGYFAFFSPLRMCAILADRCLDTICPGTGRIFFVAQMQKPFAQSTPIEPTGSRAA